MYEATQDPNSTSLIIVKYRFAHVQPSNYLPVPDEAGYFDVYTASDATQHRCYPIHTMCLKILNRVLHGSAKLSAVNQECLYHAMTDLCRRRHLDLDYGEPWQHSDTNWISRSGEEVLVTLPDISHDFNTHLAMTLSANNFALPPPAIPITPRIRHDPFATLPYDITRQILLLLPSHSVLALCTASYPIHTSFPPADRRFWDQAAHICMPWLWEIHHAALDSYTDGATTNYKGRFVWLDRLTTARKGLDESFMGMANLRRIWGVCEQLAAGYAPRLALREEEGARGGEAAVVLEKTSNVDGMPVVAWPIPEKGLRTSVSQWMCSFAHLSGGGVFEAHWDEAGTLVGMAFTAAQTVDLGPGERKCFGKDDAAARVVVVLENRITALALHMPDLYADGNLETSIKGITVHTASGPPKSLGDTRPSYCQRALSIAANHALVGIVGHISTSTGQLTRLGLLQRPTTAPAERRQPPTDPLLHRPLWRPPSRTTTTPLHNPTAFIWTHHPRLRALLPSPYRGRNPNRNCNRNSDRNRDLEFWRDAGKMHARHHADVIATDALVWGADERELRSLRRKYAVDGGRSGFGAVFADFAAEAGAPRGRGAGRWMSDTVWALYLDGAGGERVVGVGVRGDKEGVKAVRLRTNRGREVVWGETPVRCAEGERWSEPGEGETLVGLALGFVRQSELRPGEHGPLASRVGSILALSMAL